MELQVGDIVYCRGTYAKTKDRRGFIEEIVDQPLVNERLNRRGLYSIYGIDPPNGDNKLDVYFGDHSGNELEPTGQWMTPEMIEEYKNRHAHNNLIQADMNKVQEKIRERFNIVS